MIIKTKTDTIESTTHTVLLLFFAEYDNKSNVMPIWHHCRNDHCPKKKKKKKTRLQRRQQIVFEQKRVFFSVTIITIL